MKARRVAEGVDMGDLRYVLQPVNTWLLQKEDLLCMSCANISINGYRCHDARQSTVTTREFDLNHDSTRPHILSSMSGSYNTKEWN